MFNLWTLLITYVDIVAEIKVQTIYIWLIHKYLLFIYIEVLSPTENKMKLDDVNDK